MSYEFYKVIHIVGLILTFSGFAFLISLNLAQVAMTPPTRKLIFISHGIGLALLLVSGFGLAARLGFLHNIPTWIFFKLGIWLIAGGLITLIKRKTKLSVPLFGFVILLGATAAYIAVNKPF